MRTVSFFFFLFENYRNIYLSTRCIYCYFKNTYDIVTNIISGPILDIRYFELSLSILCIYFHSTRIEYILYLKNFDRFRRDTFHLVSFRVKESQIPFHPFPFFQRLSPSFINPPIFLQTTSKLNTFPSLVHTYIHTHIAPRFEF